MERRKTRQIQLGNVKIGGGAPVAVQSMTNTHTDDAAATLAQINRLAEAGCDIVRCAVPDMAAAEGLKEIVKKSPIPVIADIHFDYKMAIAAIENGADKIRINPGNIGSEGAGPCGRGKGERIWKFRSVSASTADLWKNRCWKNTAA